MDRPEVRISDSGRLADGRVVREALLSNGDLSVVISAFGATVRSLKLRTARGEVESLLTLPDLAACEADTRYIGPIVGRCANRIAGGRFDLDGESFQLSTNEGPNTLHGGAVGWSKRLWTLNPAPGGVRLAYVSPDGEEGFPGRVEAEAVFTLPTPDTVRIAYAAVTDRPTLVNLTHHLYFNLGGDPRRDVLDHELTLASGAVTPVDAALIPTGALMPTAGTAFDFRHARPIGEGLAQSDPQLSPGGGYDHNFVLDSGGEPAVTLHSPATGVTLRLFTDQPGLQIYGGQGLTAPFVPHGALVLEPQGFPDAVHHPNFPSGVLRPGETYRREALYRLAGPGSDRIGTA